MKKNFIHALLFSFAVFSSQFSFAAFCGPSDVGVGITNRSEAPALQNILCKKLPSNFVPFLPRTNLGFAKDNLKSLIICKDKNMMSNNRTPKTNWFLDVVDPVLDSFERFNYVSNAGIATSYADADDSSMQQTYLATMEYDENRIAVRRFNPQKKAWDLVNEVPDAFLASSPPKGDNDNFWCTAANQGPHFLVAWTNKLKNVVRTLLWDGSSWSQTDFNTTNEVCNVHAALNAKGTIASVVSAQKVPIIKALKAIASSSSSSGSSSTITIQSQTFTAPSASSSVASTSTSTSTSTSSPQNNNWNSSVVDTFNSFGRTPRVRAAPSSTFPSVGYQNQTNQHTVCVSSDSGLTFRRVGQGIGEQFDFAAPGYTFGAQPASSHLVSVERTRDFTNGIGRYYQSDFNNYNLITQTCEPIDPLGFISGISLRDIALVVNSIGHLISGFIGSGLFNGIQSSAFIATLFQPSNATGLVSDSIPQTFGPALGSMTTNSPLNSLTRRIENVFNILAPDVASTVQQVTSFVGPPRKKNPKFNSLLTLIQDGEQIVTSFEILSTLETANSLSRAAQTTEAIPQKGSPFSPAE